MAVDFLELTEQLERVYSTRLALRQVSLADGWPLYRATRNPAFNRHLLWSKPEDERNVLERVDAIVEASRRGRMSAVSAVVKATGEWVSLFRFQPHAAYPNVVEMGVWTHDRFWHGKYSLELGKVCVDAAFALSDIACLLGASAPQNKSSCRLMELCGLSPSQLVLRQNEQGTEVKLQEFLIKREAWLASRQKPAFSHASPESLLFTPQHPTSEEGRSGGPRGPELLARSMEADGRSGKLLLAGGMNAQLVSTQETRNLVA